ncbi:MAG: hypothetical protein ACTHNH_05225 [Mesorhizobium sp.]
MRIERTGPIPKLTPRLERFFIEALGGKSLDALQHPEARKADFQCLRGLLAIELKSLEEDGSERIDNLMNEMRKRPDWPLFLGAAPIDAIFKHLDQPDEARRKLTDRIGRAIKNHIHKANKQLGAHAQAVSRQNLMLMMVIANEDHEIYDPNLVGGIIQRHLLRRENGVLLHPHIDAVIFLSERHAAAVGEQLTFAVMCIEAASVETDTWKGDVIELFLQRWAKWNGQPLLHAEPESIKFEAVDHIPEQMARYEKWELDYKRNRYMQHFTRDQLRDRFDEVNCVSVLRFIKASPMKPPDQAVAWCMSSLSHIMLEMGWRAIPATEFRLEPLRLARAAQRLGLPSDAVLWFEMDMGRVA